MKQFFESIRVVNGQIMNLFWHQKRVDITCEKFGLHEVDLFFKLRNQRMDFKTNLQGKRGILLEGPSAVDLLGGHRLPMVAPSGGLPMPAEAWFPSLLQRGRWRTSSPKKNGIISWTASAGPP